jgi:hypothetical protein
MTTLCVSKASSRDLIDVQSAPILNGQGSRIFVALERAPNSGKTAVGVNVSFWPTPPKRSVPTLRSVWRVQRPILSTAGPQLAIECVYPSDVLNALAGRAGVATGETRGSELYCFAPEGRGKILTPTLPLPLRGRTRNDHDSTGSLRFTRGYTPWPLRGRTWPWPLRGRRDSSRLKRFWSYTQECERR